MTTADYLHAAHQVTYMPPVSPAEKALSKAASGHLPIGAVNLTWDRSGLCIWAYA